MTTNNPEVAAYRYTASRSFGKRNQKWHYQESFPHVGNRKVEEIGRIEKLISLSDYEALQAECEKLRKDAERYQSLLEAVLREIPHREGRRGNAPGHCHSVPGVWDKDNGALAGKECAWCKVWNETLAAMQGESQ